MDDLLLFGFLIFIILILILLPPITHYITSKAEYYEALTKSLKEKDP